MDEEIREELSPSAVVGATNVAEEVVEQVPETSVHEKQEVKTESIETVKESDEKVVQSSEDQCDSLTQNQTDKKSDETVEIKEETEKFDKNFQNEIEQKVVELDEQVEINLESSDLNEKIDQNKTIKENVTDIKEENVEEFVESTENSCQEVLKDEKDLEAIKPTQITKENEKLAENIITEKEPISNDNPVEEVTETSSSKPENLKVAEMELNEACRAASDIEMSEMNIEGLLDKNIQLKSVMDSMTKERANSQKYIAMMEFSNEHNKAKAYNMELSNTLLFEKIDAMQAEMSKSGDQKAEDQKSLEEKYSAEKNEIQERLIQEKLEVETRLSKKVTDLQDKLDKDVKDLEHSLMKEKNDLINNLTKENELLRELLEREKAEIEQRMSHENAFIKESKDEEINTLKEQINGLNEVLRGFQKQVSQVEESYNNIQSKLVDAQNERDSWRTTAGNLKNIHEDVTKKLHNSEEENKRLKSEVTDLQDRLTSSLRLQEESFEESHYLKENLKNAKETESNLQSDIISMNSSLSLLTQDLKETKEKLIEAQQSSQTASELRIELDTLKSELNDTKKLKTLIEETYAKATEECSFTKNRLAARQAELKAKNDKLAHHSTVFEELTLLCKGLDESNPNENINSENVVASLKQKVEEINTRLKQKETTNESLIKNLEEEKENVRSTGERLCKKEEEISEINGKLNKESEQHAKRMEELQKEKDKEMEERISTAEAKWNVTSAELIEEKERQLQERMESLTEEWSAERKELQRLTQVASAAFRSGTDSVDLLRQQVNAQRKELDETKAQHTKEMSELHALLQLKRRQKGQDSKRGMKQDDTYEFNYLQNVLFQYMMGKETETMLKILCDLVKFSNDQRSEIRREEDKKLCTKGYHSDVIES